jgi:tyrosine-protein kinase Etk/Wzc
VPLVDVFAILLRGWKTIVAFVVGAVLLITIWMIVRPETYLSRTVLLPAATQSDATSLLLAAQLPIALPGLAGLGNPNQGVIEAILASRSLEDSVVARLAPEGGNGEDEATIRRILRKGTERTAESDGSIIIEVVAPEAELSARIASEIPPIVNALGAHLNAQSALQRKEFVERQLTEAREELIEAEEALVNFQMTRQVPAVGEPAERILETAALLQQAILERDLEIVRLRRTATNENPDLRAAIADVEAMRGQLRRLTGNENGERSTGPFLGSPEQQTTPGRLLREFLAKVQMYICLL